MGTGGSEGSGTGSVISELEFWQPMREAMAARGRKPIAIPGYPFVAEKDGWAIGMVDATAKDAQPHSTNLIKRWSTIKLHLLGYWWRSSIAHRKVT